MSKGNKPYAPTTMTADYWRAKSLRDSRENVELKLDIFLGLTPADIEMKRAEKAVREQATASAKLPRPRGINHLSVAIKAAMAPSKKDGLDFKTFMRDWEQEELRELTLKPSEDNRLKRVEDGVYTVTDERYGKGNLGAKSYKWRGLGNLYSNCLK